LSKTSKNFTFDEAHLEYADYEFLMDYLRTLLKNFPYISYA